MRGITRKVSREVDDRAWESFRIPSICLMENAGAGAFRLAERVLEGRTGPVWCVAGPGNNGGDALVIARHLSIEGYDPRIALLPPSNGLALPGDAGVQQAICEAMGLPTLRLSSDADVSLWAPQLRAAALIVDGLFGTGLTRGLEGRAARIVDALNAAAAPILALDVPSGMDCDTGASLGPCVKAAVTATFVARKTGFSAPGASQLTGVVEVVGIGAPYRDLV